MSAGTAKQGGSTRGSSARGAAAAGQRPPATVRIELVQEQSGPTAWTLRAVWLPLALLAVLASYVLLRTRRASSAA